MQEQSKQKCIIINIPSGTAKSSNVILNVNSFDETSKKLHFLLLFMIDDKLVALFVSIKMLMKRDERKSLAS